MDGEKFNFKKSPYYKIVVGSLVILTIVIIGFTIYFSNIKDRGEISRSRQELYRVTESDRTSIKFEYSRANNIMSDMKVRDKYYIFDAVSEDGKIYDVKYLVDKVDFSVYIYDVHGIIIPYEDYVDKETFIGGYFYSLKELSYDEIPPATKNYLEKNGGVAFLNKVSKIVDNVDLSVANKCGGIVTYVDYIINGVSQKKLNEEGFWVGE